MSSLDPLELEVDSGEPAIESESVVVNGASQRRPLLALGVVVLLGLIGWQLFASPETSNSTSDDDGAVPEVSADADASGEEATIPSTVSIPPETEDVSEDMPELLGDESTIGGNAESADDTRDDSATSENAEPAFPLFPESPGLTLVLASPNGEVFQIDADDGTTTLMPESVSGQPSSDVSQDLPLLGRVGDTLVVVGRGKTYGYPLDGGSRIDFGDADNVVLTDDLLVMLEYPRSNNGVMRLRAFAPDGRSDYEWFDSPSPEVWMNPSGVVIAPGGTYAFTGEGFERISAHTVSAVGKNHRLEFRCDAALECTHHLVDLDTGAAKAVTVPQTNWWDVQRISPDGNWLDSTQWSDDGAPQRLLTDLRTGEQTASDPGGSDFNGESIAAAWDPTSRYAVSVGGRGSKLLIFDTQTKESREVDRSDLNVNFRVGFAVVLGADDI